jgi:hypothetical protein
MTVTCLTAGAAAAVTGAGAAAPPKKAATPLLLPSSGDLDGAGARAGEALTSGVDAPVLPVGVSTSLALGDFLKRPLTPLVLALRAAEEADWPCRSSCKRANNDSTGGRASVWCQSRTATRPGPVNSTAQHDNSQYIHAGVTHVGTSHTSRELVSILPLDLILCRDAKLPPRFSSSLPERGLCGFRGSADMGTESKNRYFLNPGGEVRSLSSPGFFNEETRRVCRCFEEGAEGQAQGRGGGGRCQGRG